MATKKTKSIQLQGPIPLSYGWVRIEFIGLADWNYKNSAPATMENLTRNILRNGQVENVLIREMENWTHPYEMTNGNHRLEVIREIYKQYRDGSLLDMFAGETPSKMLPQLFNEADPVPGELLPPLYRLDSNPSEILINDQNPLLKGRVYCFNLGKISATAAQRIAVETNETRFQSDPFALADLIKNIAGDFDPDDLTATLPFSKEEIDNFVNLTNFDFSQYDDLEGDPLGGENGNSSDEVQIVISCPPGEESALRDALAELLGNFPNAQIE